MKYKKYSSYKDSGVEWLGEIPELWDARRLGFYFKERREKVSDKVFSPLSVTKNGIVPQLENAAKSDDGDNRKKVCKGDFVINSRSDRKGSSGLSQLDGSVSLINTVIEPKNINENYIHYLLKSQPFQEEYYRYGKGIVADLWSTNYSEMKNIIISSPTLKEQQQIANFLDKATAKIDTLIEKQTKQIELLKEKRQAVISHAVTKGINPNVPMKDSGVEWLGEIPEHWEVSKLKFYTNVKGRIGFRGYTKDDLVSKEEGALVIGASEMNNNAKLEIKKPQYISWYKYYESPEIILNQGDLLFVQRGSTVGKVAHIDFDIEEATINPSLVVLKRIKLNPFYLKYYLLSNLIKAIVKVETSNTAIPMISQEQIGNYTLSFPKKEDEQQQIVNYLDEKTSKIDTLIEKSNKSIELLKEKRTALISAAVTGKIDVREFE